MDAFAARPIAAVSGGQQRVFLAQEPEVLLDEPISGVGAPTQEAILAILSGLAAQGNVLRPRCVCFCSSKVYQGG